MDHTEYLGDTLEKIAGEKFAVARSGIPACYPGDAPNLIPLFDEFCARQGAFPFVVSRDAAVGSPVVTETGCSFDFSASGLNLPGVRTGLIGRYQVSNAALALLAISRLTPALTNRFDRLTEPAIREGLLKARWPGRLEIVSRGAPMIVLDGGHNPDGVTKLVESLAELWGDRRIGLVYGVMKDKDYPACLGVLNALRGSRGPKKIKMPPSLYATRVPGMERSLAADALAEHARRMKWANAVEACDNPLDAIGRASGENDVVVVCGSLYLIGWVRPRLGRAANPPDS
jgi:dihydrofolate synthase/folylpolyglutamate synthase